MTKTIKLCAACIRRQKEEPGYIIRLATQEHHKFHNLKWAKKVYGALLDNPINKEPSCADCNSSHSSRYLTHWSEKEFCEALCIEIKSKGGRSEI